MCACHVLLLHLVLCILLVAGNTTLSVVWHILASCCSRFGSFAMQIARGSMVPRIRRTCACLKILRRKHFCTSLKVTRCTFLKMKTSATPASKSTSTASTAHATAPKAAITMRNREATGESTVCRCMQHVWHSKYTQNIRNEHDVLVSVTMTPAAAATGCCLCCILVTDRCTKFRAGKRLCVGLLLGKACTLLIAAAL